MAVGIFGGLWDSIKGITLVFHIDAEIHRLNTEREEERERRRLERELRLQSRSPSPTPSSASAMAREERKLISIKQQVRENSDERTFQSLLKKPNQPREQKTKVEKKIAKKVLKCCLLNGGFTWASILMFDQILLPLLKLILTLCYGEQSSDLHMVWGWLQSILSIIFGMMWVLPIFLLSKIVSALWFTDIANAAYQMRKGRPQLIPGISKLVADFLFSLVVQALFLVQSMLVNMLPVPYLGKSLCFVHLCLLYSLYAFEYKWFNMGWELHRRLSYIEENWSYFLGFGIPLAVLTNMSSSAIVSSCVFSIFFPLFILSGNEAKPIVGTSDTPLRLFSPVIFVSNIFFNRGSGVQKFTTSQAAQQQQKLHLQLPNLKQQQEHTLMRNTHNCDRGNQRESSEEPQLHSYRYQQPPTQVQPQLQARRSLSRSSPLRSTSERATGAMYVGGMSPLIPTPVPGAPRPQEAPTLSNKSPMVRHR